VRQKPTLANRWREAAGILVKPHHLITSSPHHLITSSPHHLITSSPHHLITSSPQEDDPWITKRRRSPRSRELNPGTRASSSARVGPENPLRRPSTREDPRMHQQGGFSIGRTTLVKGLVSHRFSVAKSA
jgi:hypothetical protein